MYIRGDGNVGIGTTAPSQKLEVAGTIYSTSGGFKFPDGTTQTTAAGGGPGFSCITRSSYTTALTVTVSCLSGESVTGGGGNITAGAINSNYPNGNAWTTVYSNTAWHTAYAVCCK